MKARAEAVFSKRTAWPADENPLSRKLAALKKAGHPVLDLTESNPTRCGFGYLRQDWLSPLASSENLLYDPSPRGALAAREAVSRYYARRGASVDPSQIVLTASTSEAYHFLFRLLADPDARILVAKPGYPLLEYLGALNDVSVTPFSLKPDGWSLDLAALKRAASVKARALMLVNPNNPTGHFISPGDREKIVRFCRERSLALLADEVFFDYAWNPDLRGVSFAAGSETLTFTMSGVSKILGLPQMKIGWIAVSGPEKEKREALRRLEIIADAYLSVNTPAQHALPFWLENAEAVSGEILRRVQNNFDAFMKLPEAGRFIKERPQGGWYAAADLPDSRSDEDWALHLLGAEHVLVHPGYLFDLEGPPKAVISLLPEPEIFLEGARRILRRL